MPTEVDEFLAHYGVPGMKWGKTTGTRAERKVQRKQASISRGNAILDKSKGSGTRAAAKIVGKDIAIRVSMNVGGVALSKATKSKSTRTGLALASKIGATSLTYNTAVKLIDTRNAVVDRRKNG